MKDIELIHGDSLQALKGYGDNHFDVAIVDPPYGIGEDGGKARTRGSKKTNGIKKGWDNNRPEKPYFDELRRVSKNQIFGAVIILQTYYQLQDVGFIGKKIWGAILLMANLLGLHLIKF